jgi:murein DD-endopeptidase MepM/ murein hydrolase activator NlpD
MRSESPVRFHAAAAVKIGSRLSLIAAIGVGGCSSIFPSREPIFTGSTQNQKEIIDKDRTAVPGYASAAPAGYGNYGQGAGVQSADLPPPAGAPAPIYTPPPVAQAPQPYTPPQAYAADVPNPRPALGAPPTTLGAQAARIDGGPAPTATAAGGGHLVQAGDTAWNISRRYGISVDQLAAANGGSTTVKLGQRINIPGGGAMVASAPAPAAPAPQPVQVASLDPQSMTDAGPATVAPAPVPVGLPPSAAELPGSAAPAAQQQAAVQPQATPPAAAAPAPEPAAASGFRWPVRGKDISGFGKKPDGERNDGINLAVPEGTAVKAAEDGTVIYAGNELKSYGNLVLIRHSNGWVSAYAHNGELKVNRGQAVKRGEVVALSGMSGGVTTPQVHFELRKEATPVDPLQHLSES